MATHFVINFFDIIINTQFMAFGVGGDSSVRVTTHRDLMGLNKTDLAILVKNTESISFSFEDDTNGLSTV
jgi:hypothetical protein